MVSDMWLFVSAGCSCLALAMHAVLNRENRVLVALAVTLIAAVVVGLFVAVSTS